MTSGLIGSRNYRPLNKCEITGFVAGGAAGALADYLAGTGILFTLTGLAAGGLIGLGTELCRAYRQRLKA